jgi:NTE family protein
MQTNPADQFIAETGVEAMITEFKNRKGSVAVSDVKDKQGNQYVDLVQQGGGVWGVALIGYVYTLEQMGIRFFSLAGTSAGAINAMAMAAIKNKDEEKGKTILELFLKLDMSCFIDGKPNENAFNKWERKLISKFVKNPKYGKLIGILTLGLLGLLLLSTLVGLVSLAFIPASEFKWLHFITAGLWVILFVLLGFTIHRFQIIAKTGFGLNSGTDFYKWVNDDILEANKIHNLEELKNHFNKVPADLDIDNKAFLREKDDIKPRVPRLAFITSDVTTNNKIELPRMWKLYYPDLKSAKPADFVRASMSIPIFFETFKLPVNPSSPNEWNEYLNWNFVDKSAIDQFVKNPIPAEVSFVDGGSLSNFPINIFYNPKYEVPRLPTFGVRLIEKRVSQINLFKNIIDYAWSIIASMKLSADKEFINKNKSYDMGIAYVEIGTTLSWLNFYMNHEEKKELFKKGAEAAIAFLDQFDWNKYKQERKDEYEHMTNTQTHNPNNW